MLALRFIAFGVALAAGLVAPACTDRGVGPAGADDGGDALVTADACTAASCSGHGRCAGSGQDAACACDKGFVSGAAFSCVPDWPCAAGQVRVDDACVPVASLTRWCNDYCASRQLACPEGAVEPAGCQPYCDAAVGAGANCLADCLGAMDEPGRAQQTICGGLLRRMDAIDCTNLAHCSLPETPTTCDALCDDAQSCGLLTDSRLLLGGSRDECVLYCRALATALAPNNRFEPLRACLSKAMQTCDPLGVLACTVVGTAELDNTLCTTAAADCGFIPDVWPDASACAAELKSWTAGQRIAVGGCLNIGKNYALCGEHHCANPPTALPPGALGAAQQLITHCPNLLSVPSDYAVGAEYYAWLFTAILEAFGKPVQRDYALVSSCFLSAPCPTTKEGTLKCLLETPKD